MIHEADPTARAAVALRPLSELDWSDINQIREKTEFVLRGLADDKKLLRELIVGIPDDPERRDLCEQDYFLSKYVLYNDPQGCFRLRLQILRGWEAETPHSHRNCFASLILRGGYEHTLFAPIDDGERLIQPGDLKPVVRRWEAEGGHYALHHSIIHSTRTMGEPCITLMVRGPSLRRKAINLDLSEGKSWWHRGAADLLPEEAELVKRLGQPEDIAKVIDHLHQQGVI